MARSRPVSKFKSYTHQALCIQAQTINGFVDTNIANYPGLSTSIAGYVTDAQTLYNAIVAVDAAELAYEQYTEIIDGYVNALASQSIGPAIPNNENPPIINFQKPFSQTPNSASTRLRWGKVKGAQMLSLSAVYTSPPVSLDVFNTAINAFQSAIDALNAAREAVVNNLNAIYAVTDNANDPQINFFNKSNLQYTPIGNEGPKKNRPNHGQHN